MANGALITELRMIAQRGRLSSLTVPVIEEAADALSAQSQLVADLASALKGLQEYASHKEDCCWNPLTHPDWEWQKKPCTCGLSALLARVDSLRATQKKEEEDFTR